MYEYQTYLIDNKFSALEVNQKYKLVPHKPGKIDWIERLLQTPIEDYRKITIGLIIIPYFIVIQNLDEELAYNKAKDWLDSCSTLRKIDSIINYHLRSAIKTAKKRIPPMKIETIKRNRPELYSLFQKKGILT